MRHRRRVPDRTAVSVQLPQGDLAKLRYRSLRARLGDDHPDTLAAVRTVAGELAAAPERLDEAIETYMSLLRRLWEQSGPRDGRYLEVTLEAAEVVLRGGDRNRAAEMFRHVLDTRLRMSGPDHPDAVRARRALAGLGAAERRSEPSTVHDMMRRNERAAALVGSGDLDGAAAEFADIVDWCELALGHRDRRTLASRTDLAATLFKLGHLDRAEDLYRRIVEDQPDDADGTAHNNLGTVLFHLGRVEEAEPILRQALRMHRRASGTGDAETTRATENLARALARLGHRAEARALAEDYLRMHSHDHPSRHDQAERVRRLLADL